jgi:hypothetical protein
MDDGRLLRQYFFAHVGILQPRIARKQGGKKYFQRGVVISKKRCKVSHMDGAVPGQKRKKGIEMVKIIKLSNSGLAPTMRSGCHERVSATWGVEVDGRLVARIFTDAKSRNSIVVDAVSGRCLYQTIMAPWVRGQSRVGIAKNWAMNNFSGAPA